MGCEAASDGVWVNAPAPISATDNLAQHMAPVARALLGEPNRALSSGGALRYGNKGSLSVDMDKGSFYDHEEGVGGGVLDLIVRERDTDLAGAFNFLREIGCDVPDQRAPSLSPPRPVASYDYLNPSGELVFQVLRMSDKSYRQRRPDGQGGWIWKTKGVDKMLYRLPEIAENPGKVIYFVEGEKDADRLLAEGKIATTSPEGAGKWKDEYAAPLAGRQVCILPDNDKPGRDHARQVSASLAMQGVDCRVLELPDLPEKGDVSDWLDAGSSIEELARLASEAFDVPLVNLPLEPQGGDGEPDPFNGTNYRLLNSASFVAGFSSPDYTLDGILRRGWLYTLTAPTGSGKTAVTMQLAESIALGEPLLDIEVAQGAVLYLAGENPDDVRSRFIASLAERGIDAADVPIFFADGVFSIRENLTQIAADLEAAGVKLTLVVVDTLAAYFDGDDLNSNAQQQHFATTVLRSLTRLPGCPTVIVPAHPVKNASKTNLVPMGGSALLNQVDGNLTAWRTDTTIAVHWQGKFRGAPFEPMHFELVNCTCDALVDSRGRHMPTVHARPLTIQRGTTLASQSEEMENRVLEMIEANPKVAVRAIGDDLGISKSSAQRIKDRLLDMKWIKKEGRDLVLTSDGRKVIAK